MRLMNRVMLNSSIAVLLGLGTAVCPLVFGATDLTVQQNLDPRACLEKIIYADNWQGFQGVFSYKRDGYSVESFVHQQINKKSQVEQWIKSTKDDEGFLRLNGKVQCVTKGYKGRFRASTMFHAIRESEIDDLLKDYHVSISPNELLVGDRRAKELVFTGKTGDRYVYKLVFDIETWFPLQFSFLDNKNNVLEQGGFKEFTPELNNDMAVKPLDNCINVTFKTIKNDKTFWSVAWLPSGFELEKLIKNEADKERHLVFSDGLVSFSVFVEPATDPNMVNLERHFGATVIVSRKLVIPNVKEQYVVTVVGEIPLSTAEAVAASVYHR